ncbi:MAG: FKBP-type peptidyl-prolyl cis-trans isomerase [Candidatus Aenigmatarchaeota archaeon]
MRKMLAMAVLAALVCGCIGQTGTDSTPTKGVDYTKQENLEVAKGDTVSVYYTGTFVNGTVFDSNVGGRALTFRAGMGQMIPGFDNGVIGMKMNEEKTLTLPPEQAYGTGSHPLANETLVFKVKVVSISK